MIQRKVISIRKSCNRQSIAKKMPPKRGKAKKVQTWEEESTSVPIDVQYNPDIVTGLLQELGSNVETKCAQIQKDSDFMITSIKQAFHLEMIKLPTQVKQMSLTRFKEEFGDSLEAVTKGAISKSSRSNNSNTSNIQATATKSSRASSKVFQTPSHSRAGDSSKIIRNPKEGEKILSVRGSPLGEFQTEVKAAKPGGGLAPLPQVPATPGIFVPLGKNDHAEVVSLENLDVDNLSEDAKKDALNQMQSMMEGMQAMMAKLNNGNAAQR